MASVKSTQAAHATPAAAAASEGSLLTFPSDIPISVIGDRQDGLANAVAACVRGIVSDFDANTIEMRPSKTGKYLAVAFTARFTSRAQLDALNEALKAHPMVKMVL